MKILVGILAPLQWLSKGEISLRIRLVVLTQYRRVTHRRTDILRQHDHAMQCIARQKPTWAMFYWLSPPVCCYRLETSSPFSITRVQNDTQNTVADTLPRDAMHSADYAVARCLSVRILNVPSFPSISDLALQNLAANENLRHLA